MQLSVRESGNIGCRQVTSFVLSACFMACGSSGGAADPPALDAGETSATGGTSAVGDESGGGGSSGGTAPSSGGSTWVESTANTGGATGGAETVAVPTEDNPGGQSASDGGSPSTAASGGNSAAGGALGGAPSGSGGLGLATAGNGEAGAGTPISDTGLGCHTSADGVTGWYSSGITVTPDTLICEADCLGCEWEIAREGTRSAGAYVTACPSGISPDSSCGFDGLIQYEFLLFPPSVPPSP